MKRVLVTGAGGFIGLNIVKQYSDYGWEVVALVHNNVPGELYKLRNVLIIKGDVTDKKFMLQFDKKIDVLCHVAGIASDIGSDKLFRKLNYEPIKYLAYLPKDKIIYISSTDVYGIKDFENANENTPFFEYPKNPYPKYKILSEKWLRKSYCNYVILRPAAVWGNGDKTLESRVVDFLETSPFIVHFGKWRGKNRWPLANVENVAKTAVAVSMSDEFNNQAINIIDPEKISIYDYYKNIAAKYFPDKSFKTITLPLWAGKFIGIISTLISNICKRKQPIFDPTFYAVHHVSSNLDFSSEKMIKALKILERNL